MTNRTEEEIRNRRASQPIGRQRRNHMKKIRNIIASHVYNVKEAENKYIPMSTKGLRELAMDIESNRVFTNLHLPPRDHQLVQSIFMPLAFAGSEFVFRMRKNKIVMIYEYYDKAGPRSINGYPIFFSMKQLDYKDYMKMEKFRAKIKAFKEEYGEIDE